MRIDFNLASVTVFFLIAIGIFVSILLLIKRENKTANKYLSVLSFLLSLWLLDTFFRVADIYGQNPNLYFVPIFYSFGFGPLIYFYTLHITQTRSVHLLEKIIHFTPAFLQGLFYLYLQLRSYDFRFNFWFEIHKPYTYDLELALSFLSLSVYLYVSRKHIEKYKSRIENYYSSIHKIALRWLNQLHWVLFAVSIFLLLETIARVVWNFYPSTPLSSITMGIIIILIAIGALMQSSLDTVDLAFEDTDQSEVITLNDTELHLLEGIKHKMIDEQLYLQPELTLKEFAQHVQLPARETSRLINKGLNLSFIDFVNHYRVSHFKFILTQTNSQHLSFLGVALESGFN